jgi:hypothetical protein
MYGASPLVTPSEFIPTLKRLWDPSNPERDIMLRNAKELYSMKGKSAVRVATFIGKVARFSFSEKVA